MTIDHEFAGSSPVFRVSGKVESSLARDVAHLQVSEDVGGLRSLVVDFQAFGPTSSPNDGLLYLDRRVLDFGCPIDVAIGVSGTDRTVFSGTVSELSVTYGNGTPPTVGVCAEDNLMRLRMTRRCRTYQKSSDAEIIRAIAKEHGVGSSVQLEGPSYDLVHQANQTDLAFVRERARAVNGEVWFADGKLCAASRQQRVGTAIKLIQNENLIDVTVRADLAHQRSKVSVLGYDASARDVIETSADVSAIRAEVKDGLTGIDVLQQAVGTTTTTRADDAPLTTDEAKSWATGDLLRRARRFVTVSGTTRGTPDMIVGSLINLTGVAPIFDGPGYYVTSFCHTYDTVNGLRTAFEAERATIGSRR